MSLEKLHQSLRQRKRPEDIAQIILEQSGSDFERKELSLIKKAAKGSLKHALWGYTSMAQEFGSAVGAGKQIKKAIEIFKIAPNDEIDYNRTEDIERFIQYVSPLIHKEVGKNDFVADRLNKEARKEAGLEISKRNYNKKWRLLKRLEKKLAKFRGELEKNEFQMIANHGLAHTLTFDEFAIDQDTANFIAYFNARCNLRSVFTNQSQVRPFDEISAMLFNRCKKITDTSRPSFKHSSTPPPIPPSANWWAIAHIYPSMEVLGRLTDQEKGELLGKWTQILRAIAALLQSVWESSEINRKSMIVRKGNDSSTWNNTAGAWNKARDNWINLIYSLGMDDLLDQICFGKVMRLMAADVVAWHQSSGGGLDPNTQVWNQLPLPWEVFEGKAFCNRKMVIQECKKAGLDPAKSGWIAPRQHSIVPFTPTPELVHGVAIADPFMASILKKHKFFSGKKAAGIHPEEN